MDFHKLREMQLNERKPRLQSINESFYDDVVNYLNPNTTNITLARNMKNCAVEILRSRFHKIVNSAMLYVETGNDLYFSNMTDEEYELNGKLIDIFEEWCGYEK